MVEVVSTIPPISPRARPEALFYPETMAQVDRCTIEGGTPGITLMERAGAEVARVLRGLVPPQPVSILCGPGQNGGDGWIIARRLAQAGWPVSVYSDWPAATLSGDAKIAAKRDGTAPQPLSDFVPESSPLVIDALFGAGLSRALEGAVAAAIERAAAADARVLAVDLPSGLSGRTGEVLGVAPTAFATVTFERGKPGHHLGQGPSRCGALYVRPIGLLTEESAPDAFHNAPSLWAASLPYPPSAAHKYERGGAVVVGGPRHSGGAARLTARATATAGAGAVTVACSPSAADMYSAAFDAIMVAPLRAEDALPALISAKKCAAVGIGPGLGTDEQAKQLLRQVIEAGTPCVLDADALTLLPQVFGQRWGQGWAEHLPEKAILTPHEGELARLFPDLSGDALSRAMAAAEICGRTVILKGATSVVATPGEVPVLNTHASPWLATAGSGDVLAGICLGLLAQGGVTHKAACAATWLHGEAARQEGAGLTADDLPDGVRAAIRAVSRA